MQSQRPNGGVHGSRTHYLWIDNPSLVLYKLPLLEKTLVSRARPQLSLLGLLDHNVAIRHRPPTLQSYLVYDLRRVRFFQRLSRASAFNTVTKMEHTVGIAPTNLGFADRSVH